VRSCKASLALNDGVGCQRLGGRLQGAGAVIEILGHEPGCREFSSNLKAAAHYAAAVAMRFYTG
jgi:hypothetical protein